MAPDSSAFDVLADMVWAEAWAGHEKLLTRWAGVRFERVVVGAEITVATPDLLNSLVAVLVWEREHRSNGPDVRPYTLCSTFHLGACESGIRAFYSTDRCYGWLPEPREWDVDEWSPATHEREIRADELRPLVLEWLDALVKMESLVATAGARGTHGHTTPSPEG
jgi:hypothetical protein